MHQTNCTEPLPVYRQKARHEPQGPRLDIQVVLLPVPAASAATREHAVRAEGVVFGNLQRKGESKSSRSSSLKCLVRILIELPSIIACTALPPTYAHANQTLSSAS